MTYRFEHNRYEQNFHLTLKIRKLIKSGNISPSAGSKMIKIIDKIGLAVELTDAKPDFKFNSSSLQMIASQIMLFQNSLTAPIRLSRSLSERHEECVALGNRKMSKYAENHLKEFSSSNVESLLSNF